MNEETGLATDGQREDPYAEMRKAKPWLDGIKAYEKAMQTYNQKCDKIDELYASLEKMAGDAADREFQIFWANLEVLKPSIYSRPPIPVVTARFKDRKELPRHASEILERSLITSFDTEDIDITMRHCRDDLATNARAASWLRFEEDEQGQRVVYDHLDRRDFAHEIARKWKEVGWVARRDWLTKDQMRERFEEVSGDLYLKADYKEHRPNDDRQGGVEQEEEFYEKKAAVWQIWSKDKSVVVWVSPDMEDVLDILPPFLDLESFWPCPRPAYGTLVRGTLKPVPDFAYYKDQVEEINELTARISALAEALRLKGFYSAGVEELSDAIEAAIKSTDNNAFLVPVPNTAALGGNALKDQIVWMPVKEVAEVITQLIGLRRQLIDDVYQITGLSDIMRGATDPNETLGAQQLKSQYGSVRIRDRQHELVRLARDITLIAGEIIAENFSPQTILEMSQYEEVPTQQQVQAQIQSIQQQVAQAANNPQLVELANQNDQTRQMAQQAVQQAQKQIQELQQSLTIEQVFQFIRDQRMRPFVLEIETDSTIQPDEMQAQEQTTKFLGALSTALGQLAPMVQAQPQSAPFAAEVLKFATSPFRAGRQLEGAIDEFADQMKQLAQRPEPNPEQEKAKLEAQKVQQEHQLKMGEMQIKMQESQQKFALDMEQAQADIEKTNAEVRKVLAEIERIQAQAQAASSSQEAA